jgi:hypothetical protein
VIETVPVGLGPGFNELSCGSCHIFPAVGGSNPTTSPQVTDANTMGATNVVPSFITANGPIREARFVLNPDRGVHDLFSIQGRSDAPGCVFAQPNFIVAVADNNIIFRVPPPTFGDGLVGGLSDQSLQSTFAAQAQQNASVGISGHFNLSDNAGNITRFGWKAQNASMLMFAGEAYNVEEGVTNDLFPNKRNNPTCRVPNRARASPRARSERLALLIGRIRCGFRDSSWIIQNWMITIASRCGRLCRASLHFEILCAIHENRRNVGATKRGLLL